MFKGLQTTRGEHLNQTSGQDSGIVEDQPHCT